MTQRRARTFPASCLLFALLAAGCGGGDGDSGEPLEGDPRCVTLCQIDEPSPDGAFDVCSQASAELCVSDCEARIEGTESPCASCLLDDAYFDQPENVGSSPFCQAGTCTMNGREGECTYPEGDEAAEDDCYRQVSPRREVQCDADYRDPVECGSLCS